MCSVGQLPSHPLDIQADPRARPRAARHHPASGDGPEQPVVIGQNFPERRRLSHIRPVLGVLVDLVQRDS